MTTHNTNGRHDGESMPGPDLTDAERQSVGRAVELDGTLYRHCPKCDGQIRLNRDWGVWVCSTFAESHVWPRGRFEGVGE